MDIQCEASSEIPAEDEIFLMKSAKGPPPGTTTMLNPRFDAKSRRKRKMLLPSLKRLPPNFTTDMLIATLTATLSPFLVEGF